MIDQLCGEDPSLRDEVVALIDAFEPARDALDAAASNPAKVREACLCSN